MVSIIIYDVMARNIRTLMNIKQNTDLHSTRWNATTNIGEGVSVGMHIYIIQAGELK
tara:strand:- start:319 stop:489 length:171 start_codon:yes stop_codon:yes gene_type:complete